jgi:hypothetical protein
MFPWYANVPQDFSLPEDDKVAVQHLYGPRYHQDGAPAHLPPKETLPSVVVPATGTTTPPPRQTVPQKCQTNFDAVRDRFKNKYLPTAGNFSLINFNI